MIDCSNTSCTCNRGGSRPSEKDGGDGGGGKGCAHPDPQIKRGGGALVSKFFFRLFGPQFGLKVRVAGGPLPRICHCVHCMCIIVMVNLRNVQISLRKIPVCKICIQSKSVVSLEFTYWIIKSVYYFNKSINHIVPCWLNESFIVNINLQQNK